MQSWLIVEPLDDVFQMIYLIEKGKIVTDYLVHTWWEWNLLALATQHQTQKNSVLLTNMTDQINSREKEYE